MLKKIKPLFKEPETPFGAPSVSVNLENAKAVLYGVPLDVSTSFGKGTSKGPSAMRKVSADLLEIFMNDFNEEYPAKIPIYDLGDLELSGTKEEQLDKIKKLESINSEIRGVQKIPVVLGGEHTISLYTISGVASENPVILHFDAHRDFKPIYLGEKICHTTPFYHLLNKHALDLVQIGIRQTDAEENKLTEEKKVTTITGWDARENFQKAKQKIMDKIRGRKVYVSFDIDCLDSSYTPATGTPVSFGMTPWQVLDIIKEVGMNASEFIGFEVVEVGKDQNFREAELAVQLLLRMLMHSVK